MVLGWLQHLSPFIYYRSPDPIAHGLDPADAAILAVIALVATGIAAVAFDRRDLDA